MCLTGWFLSWFNTSALKVYLMAEAMAQLAKCVTNNQGNLSLIPSIPNIHINVIPGMRRWEVHP